VNNKPVNSFFISICIPAYKRAEYLTRLLQRIQIQTFKDFEVVITDDSPGDDVLNLQQEYQPLFKINYRKNAETLGTPANWNEGIRLATGDWIKIMHDDDWFASADSLQKFVQLIKDNPNAGFLFSGSAFIKNNKVFGKMSISKFHSLLLKKNPLNLYYKNFIGPPSVVIHKNKKEIWYDTNMKWLVDVDFYIRYLQEEPAFAFTKEALINVGYSQDQVTEKVFHDKTVFVKENLIMLQKQPHNLLKKIWNYDYTWRMMRNYKIRKVEELEELYPAAAHNIPNVHKSILDFQKFVPDAVLKVGVFSKVLMMVSFIITRLRS
jgi:glycosyltransferase involved in cell wall biosynthesis